MDIYIRNSYHDLPKAFKSAGIKSRRICLIGDSNTMPLYGEAVSDILKNCFEEVHTLTLPAGEEHKNLDTIETVYDFLLDHQFDRKDVLAALGGGVIGDMTGFAAATYRRGIRFVQLPTTLLAQVDASIGGKTGVDFKGFKNMVGAFHMPEFVFANARTLSTLPDDQYASGMGEVLKSALLADEDFYEQLLTDMVEIRDRDPEAVLKMVKKCADIKAKIVEQDPTEQGVRALLNLGHTIGHAIEQYKNFTMSHGACVALGCIAAASISHKRGLIGTEELYEIRDMFVAFDLPIFVDGIVDEEILALTRSDKKMSGKQLRFILLKNIGEAFVADDVTDEELLSGIKFINGEEIVYEE